MNDLNKETDIYNQVLETTPRVNKVLDHFLLEHAFVNGTSTLYPRPTPLPALPAAMPRTKPCPIKSNTTFPSTSRAFHTVSDSTPASWKTSALGAISKATHEKGTTFSDDASIVLLLMCFLAPSSISMDLISRGATPRKRWNKYGKIDEMDATHVGLDPDLRILLSAKPRLSDAFLELGRSSIVSKQPDCTYVVDESIAPRVCANMSAKQISFWRCQALVVAYRAIPWKYIEPPINPNTFQSHLKYAIDSFQDGLDQLPTCTRADLGATLVEAFRFPDMGWKRFVVGRAEVIARSMEDDYLHARIAQSACILNRITGRTDHAVSSLDNVSQSSPSIVTDNMMHSVLGQTAIQRSLNNIQVEDLSSAKTILQNWHALDPDPSPMEEVVLFRKGVLLGRILRFEGNFETSRTHLEKLQETIQKRTTSFLTRNFMISPANLLTHSLS